MFLSKLKGIVHNSRFIVVMKSIYYTSVKFNTSLRSYDHSFTTAYLKGIFENLAIISGNPLSDEIDFRDDCCSDLSVPTYATFSNNTWNFSLNSGSLCTCYDWFNNTVGGNSLINISCCDNSEGLNQLDGGLYEAGIDGLNPGNYGGSFNDWLLYYTAWLEYWSEQTSGGSGSIVTGENNNNNILISTILTDIKDEQRMLGWLTRNFLQPNFGTPAPIDYINLFAANPHIAAEFYKYLQGFYEGIQVVEQNAIDLAELLVNNSPFFELHNYEIQHILTYDPDLIADIETFLADHPDDVMAIQVIHDFLSLEYCPPSSPSCTDYPNEFEAILALYSSLNQNQYDWLHSEGITTVLGGVTTTIHDSILDFLLTNTSLSQPEKIENINTLINIFLNFPSLNLSHSLLQDLLDDSQFLGFLENNIDLEFTVEEIEWLLEINIPATDVSKIDGTIFMIDENNVLHIKIDPMDTATSSNIEKLSHVFHVIHEIRAYYCKSGEYYPIDWADYFINLGNLYLTDVPYFFKGDNEPYDQETPLVIDWDNPPAYLAYITLDLNVTAFGTMMDTDPSWNHGAGDNHWLYIWKHVGTNAPMLSITVPLTHHEEFQELLFSDCD